MTHQPTAKVRSRYSITAESSQLKPPLHPKVQLHMNEYENDSIKDIMNITQQERPYERQSNQEGGMDFDDDDDFMTRIVDGTCRGIFPLDGHDDGDSYTGSICQLPSCHLSERLDVLMHCRQPLSLFSFFHEIKTEEGTEVVHILPAGAYLLPKQCEYCGQCDTKLCTPETCSRPNFYLQKKRPPFCKPNSDLWDTNTDHAIYHQVSVASPSPEYHVSDVSQSQGNWVSDFFRGSGSRIEQQQS